MIEILVSAISAAAALGASWIAHRTHREVRPRTMEGQTNGVSAGQVLYSLFEHTQTPVNVAHPGADSLLEHAKAPLDKAHPDE